MESGTALCPWAYQDRINLASHVSDVSSLLQCPFNTSENVINCLRNASVEQLVSSTNVFDSIARMAQLTWTPTAESDNENAFLTDAPKHLIHKMKDLPFIVGVNTQEGLLVTSSKLFKFHFMDKEKFV